jgi:hypothetical protein
MLSSMKVTAVLTQEGRRWIAQCEQVDRAGEGTTPELAVASLREALRDYFGQAEAVAPPANPPAAEAIDIEIVDGP